MTTEVLAMRGRWLLSVVAVAGLGAAEAACGDGGEKGAADTAVVTTDTVGDTGGTGATDTVAAPDALGGCSETDLDACEYESPVKSFTVRDGYIVHDDATGRDLRIKVRVPAGAGPLPAVIWSHGGGFSDGGDEFSEIWASLLASRGYVVINVAHALPNATTGAAVCALAGLPTAECNFESDESDGDAPLVAVIKTYDVLAVLDELPTLSSLSTDAGGPAIDLGRVAVAGWSAGSRAPQTVSGLKTRLSASAPIFTRPDLRVKATVAMSPTGPGFVGLYDEAGESSWDTMRGPTLSITGENDEKPSKPDLTGPLRAFGFSAQPGDGTRWLLYSNLAVGVGGHATYNLEDKDSSDERLRRLTRAIGSAALAFLDAELNDDDGGKAWLASDNARILAGEADWKHR